MNPIHIADVGFPGVISELIGRASMDLPPLVGPRDDEFLDAFVGIVGNIFWMNYIGEFSEEAQMKLRDAVVSGNESVIAEWQKGNADFLSDTIAQAKADKVIGDLEAALPRIMTEEYARFQETFASA